MSLRPYLEQLTTNRSSYEMTLPQLLRIAGIPKGGKHKDEMVAALEAFYGNEETIVSLWRRLTDFEKDLMETFIRCGQSLDYEDLTQLLARHGKTQERHRSFSPIPLGLLAPESPARLFFIGLTIPPSLEAIVTKLMPPLEVLLTGVDEGAVRSETDYVQVLGDDFAGDMNVMITMANSTKLRTTKSGGLPTKAAALQWNRAFAHPEPFLPSWRSADDMWTIEDTTRLYGMAQLLMAADVLRNNTGVMAVGSQASAFLQADPIGRCRLLLGAYVNTCAIQELHRIPEVKARPERPGSMKRCRETIIACLAHCPVGEWIDSDELIDYIRRSDKGFLVRETGPIPTYDPNVREYYDGMYDWRQLEGRFVEVVLLEYLAALGIVDVAANAATDGTGIEIYRLRYIRLTAFGAFILGFRDHL
ncbi:hypothetical protein [Paenibacillus cymbidii]|uniref:hypothetical protein n=1 Tax=Paenibacillus cymbidii TaxID=1639034 RepID=UPI0010820C61|nr:hypothetical protein [Paenibacillus cymbidii]